MGSSKSPESGQGEIVSFGGTAIFGYDRLVRVDNTFVAIKGKDVPPLRMGATVELVGDSRGYVPGGFRSGDVVEVVGFTEPFGRLASDDVVEVSTGAGRRRVKPSNIARIVSAPAEAPDQDVLDGEPPVVRLAFRVPEPGEQDPEHLARLREGVEAWNAWRLANPEVMPRLAGADLRGIALRRVNLEGADLSRVEGYGIDLYEANLRYANLHRAFLQRARLPSADLSHAELTRTVLVHGQLAGASLREVDATGARLANADLTAADLGGADLTEADLTYAHLFDASLAGATLVETGLMATLLIRVDLAGATLDRCRVHGASVWKIRTDERTTQSNLIVTDYADPTLTTDSLEVAQLIHSLINMAAMREVIDSMTGKAVLLLGRFTPERLAVLEAIARRLRELGDLPIIFNFDKPADRSVSETVRILAGLSKFMIVDLTDPKSAPYESRLVIPELAVPCQPIVAQGEAAFSMFDDLRDYSWLLEGFAYEGTGHLIENLEALRAEALDKRRAIGAARSKRNKGFRTSLPKPGSTA